MPQAKRIEIESYELMCPLCLSPEVDTKTGLLNIRGFKVQTEDGVWRSQCLVCIDKPNKGWFCTEMLTRH